VLATKAGAVQDGLLAKISTSSFEEGYNTIKVVAKKADFIMSRLVAVKSGFQGSFSKNETTGVYVGGNHPVVADLDNDGKKS
jgi:hypothetical protein